MYQSPLKSYGYDISKTNSPLYPEATSSFPTSISFSIQTHWLNFANYRTRVTSSLYWGELATLGTIVSRSWSYDCSLEGLLAATLLPMTILIWRIDISYDTQIIPYYVERTWLGKNATGNFDLTLTIKQNIESTVKSMDIIVNYLIWKLLYLDLIHFSFFNNPTFSFWIPKYIPQIIRLYRAIISCITNVLIVLSLSYQMHADSVSGW